MVLELIEKKKKLANVHFLNYNFFSVTYSRAEFSHRQFKQLLPEMSLQDSNYNEKFLYFHHSQKNRILAFLGKSNKSFGTMQKE